MIRALVKLPDSRLRQPSVPVTAFDDSLRALVDDMFDTMHAADGIGLAAVQIGVPLRVAVMAVEDNPTRVLVNPEFEALGEPMPLEEGCLSVPGMREQTRARNDWLRVRALDLAGEPFEFEARDLEAACVQHECDHMNGRLYIDTLSALKRRRLLKRYEKAQREGASP